MTLVRIAIYYSLFSRIQKICSIFLQEGAKFREVFAIAAFQS